MSRGNGTKVKIDVAVLEERVERLDSNVEKILNNHLPHLHARLDSIEVKLAYYIGGATAIISLIEIIAKFLK